jgi:hypothetical protein
MKSLRNPNDKDELLRRLMALRPDSRRRWGKMSPHQMVCHLGDSFLTAFGEKEVSPATSLFQRTVVRWIALNSPLPWPHGIKTRPEVDQEVGGTRPVEFGQDVEALRLFRERLRRCASIACRVVQHRDSRRRYFDALWLVGRSPSRARGRLIRPRQRRGGISPTGPPLRLRQAGPERRP